MKLIVTQGLLPGVLRIEPRVHGDERGFFAETFRVSDYTALGLPPFVQENIALSQRGVLRGLHFQQPNAQGKLLQVLSGAIFDVVVDLRSGSPTFGQVETFDLSALNFRQLYVPPGFAHGYQALMDGTVVSYKCTAYYDPASEFILAWNDPALGISWPLPDPVCSARDARGLPLSGLPPVTAPSAVLARRP